MSEFDKEIRNTLWDIIKGLNKDSLFTRPILMKAKSKLKAETTEEQQAILTCYYDLFREGYLSWGWNIDNPDSPAFHLTKEGQKELDNLS